MPDKPDVYRVLQVLPTADPWVLHAAFRALARRYHPDGEAPDPRRMADVNRAYALVRSPELRAIYDRSHGRSVAVGPGSGASGPPAGWRQPPPSDAGTFARAAARRRGGEEVRDEVRLDFGRYMGWTLGQLAGTDPDYLRWLARHSSGLRYRAAIQRELRNVDLGFRDKATA